MRAWFVSDVHIKDLNERNSIRLLRFFHSLEAQERSATHLFLLGDIFDLWAGDSSFFEEKFKPFVEILKRINKSGVRVVYFEGNHDIHVKKFWEQKEIEVWTEPKYFQLDPYLIRLEHGDFINPIDKAYKRFRKFMRSSFMETIAYQVPGTCLESIGRWGSRKSRRYSLVRRQQNKEKFQRMIRDYAKQVYDQGSFDYLIAGHMHIRDEFFCVEKKMHSINLGSWFDQAKVLLLTELGHEWVLID